MYINAILLAISSLVGIVVIGIFVSRHVAKSHPVFVSYLTLVIVSSLCSFMIEAGFFPYQTWHYVLLVVFVAITVVYYHFTRVFLGKPAGWSTYLAYVGVFVLTILFSIDGILPTFHLLNDNLSLYLTGLPVILFLGMVMYSIVQRFSKTTNPHMRNVIVYLLVGASVLALSTGINLILTREQYFLPAISNLINAMIISYVILKANPADAYFMIRKALVFIFAMLCISVVFSSVIYFYYDFLPDQPTYGVVIFLSSCAILLALATHPLRLTIEKWLNWFFYRRTSRYRETLFHFGSKLGSIISLNELASEILPTLSKALLLRKATLLVEDDMGTFTAQFTYPKGEEGIEERLRFSTVNPLVIWLGRGNTLINLDQFDEIRELRELNSSEKVQIKTAGLDILCPIKSRGKLVGILALGREHTIITLSYRDMQLIMVTAGQIGVLIENARLYSQALSWALTDGLTGLYNARHFHRSLEKEIARCSRHNSVLSLIMLDIDRFKEYNDTFGHLAGDKVIETVGKCIHISIRTEDTGCRYGGEEFAVILPETNLKDAYSVAERIRETIEKNLSSSISVITASFGIASWPNDGVTEEDIIACADAALYLAKQTGRNRTCMSSDLRLPDLRIQKVCS